MSGRKATTDDVARLAGVSRITVDRVLNARGGVKPDTERRVIAAARSLGLDRALTFVPTRILRVGVVLQNASNPYYAMLKEGFRRAALLHAKTNVRLSFFYFGEIDGGQVGQAVRAATAVSDALIVVLFEQDDVRSLVSEISRRLPVVTLASDLPGTGRIGHVGANAAQEGRTAGALMGRFLGRGGDVIIVTGLDRLSEHEQRVEGFTSTLTRHYPACRIVDQFQSFEADDISDSIRERLVRFPGLRGIYNMSVGHPSIGRVLRAFGKEHEVHLIAHTVSPDLVALLEEGVLDAIIDRDPHLDARRALEIQLHAAGRLAEADISSPQRPQIFLRENVRKE